MLEEVKKEWVNENGIGHWKLSLNGVVLHCDEGEIKDAESELRQMVS